MELAKFAALLRKKKQRYRSGPTFITIRSAKHDSSTAYTHGYDFQIVMEKAEFKDC